MLTKLVYTYWFVAVFFLLVPLRTWSMHNQNAIITLIVSDNKTCVVPSLLAYQLSYIIAGNHYKYQQGKANTIFEVPFSKDIVENVILCIDYPQYYVQQLARTELIAIFNAADYLGAPAVILAVIAHRITHELNKNDLPENIQQRIQTLPLHLKSLSKLSGEHAIVVANEQKLDLRALNLETLDNLDEVLRQRAIDRTQIIYLDASYNNIVGVSLHDICKALPQVKHINLSYNKLNEVSAADLIALPQDMKLDISNNSIARFDQRNQGSSIISGLTIDARNNRLSVKQLNALKKLLNKPAYYKSLAAKAQKGLSAIQNTLFFLSVSLLPRAIINARVTACFLANYILFLEVPVLHQKLIDIYDNAMLDGYQAVGTIWLSVVGISLMSRMCLNYGITRYLKRVMQKRDNKLVADILDQCPRPTEVQLSKLQERMQTWFLAKKKQLSLAEITALPKNIDNTIE